MKTHYTVALAMCAGFGLGAFAVQGLHAQANAPVYSVAEIDIADQAAYSAYVPKARAALKAAGGKILVAGGKITAGDGEPPKSRAIGGPPAGRVFVQYAPASDSCCSVLRSPVAFRSAGCGCACRWRRRSH
jgi:hypothetical protein